MEAKGSITPLTKTQRFFVILTGLAFIVAGVYMYADIFNFGKGVKTTEGTVVGLLKDKHTHRSGSTESTSVYYRPIVEFTVGTAKYKFASSTGSGSGFGAYEVGQTVRVNYDPKNPSKSPNLAGKKELFWPMVPVLCGAIAMLLGVFAPSKKQ